MLTYIWMYIVLYNIMGDVSVQTLHQELCYSCFQDCSKIHSKGFALISPWNSAEDKAGFGIVCSSELMTKAAYDVHFVANQGHLMSPCCGPVPGHGHALDRGEAQGCGKAQGFDQFQGHGQAPGHGQGPRLWPGSRLWLGPWSFLQLSSTFYLSILAFPGPQGSKPIVPPKLLMSPWCWVWLKFDEFSISNSKQKTSLLESREEHEDLVPNGLWAIVAYIFLANLYTISPPIP